VSTLLPGALLGALSAVLYARALRIPFVYDDRITVLDNPSIQHLGQVGAILHFTVFRPLVNLSFAVDHALWGLDPAGYHLTNVGLHALNVLLLWALLVRVVADMASGAGTGLARNSGASPLAAIVSTALFAVHPMMTEAVVYVTGRSDVLCGTFFLLALLLMREGLRTERASRIALSLTAFVLALAAKEVAVAFPFVTLAYDRLIIRPARAASRRRLLRLHLPLIGAVVLLGALRLLVFLEAERSGGAPAPARMFKYLWSQFEAVWMYAGLLIWPLHQSIAHNTSGRFALSLLGLGALVASCVLAYCCRRWAPLECFGVTWYWLLLMPSSSLVPLQYAIAEHRVYLASIGPFIIAGALFARLAFWLRRRSAGLDRALYGSAVLVMAGLAALTVTRITIWANPVALWREAAVTAPRWDTYTALGNALRDAGDCTGALAAYNVAARIAPDRLLPMVAGWVCLVAMGRQTDAEAVVQRLRAVDPQLERICGEIHALAPHMVSVQACRSQLRQEFDGDSAATIPPSPSAR
jgi:hypothetical protein